jgi:hypothetical protein
LASAEENLVFLCKDRAACDSENEKGEVKKGREKNALFFSIMDLFCFSQLWGSTPLEQPDRCCRGNIKKDFQRISSKNPPKGKRERISGGEVLRYPAHGPSWGPHVTIHSHSWTPVD